MTKASAAVFEAAGRHLGLEEWPGSKHNPAVVEFFEDVGHGWVKDDETPWCAAFVGSVLGECGIAGTGKLNARSYLDWGEPVDNPVPGDVVVFWRGTRDGWQGHVAFFVKWQGGDLVVRGGNQGNKVSDAVYSRDRLLGFRRAKQPRTSLLQSTSIQAGAGGIVATATGGATAIASLDDTAQIVAIVAACVVGLAFLWMMKERKLKWDRGIK